MRGVTHISVGAAGYFLMEPLLSSAGASPGLAETLLAVTAGSLVPDIDHPDSMLSNSNPLLSSRIVRFVVGALLFAVAYFSSRGIGSTNSLFFAVVGGVFIVLAFLPHRGATHSLLLMFVAGACMYCFWPHLAVPFLIGYAMHLIMDSFTGYIPLFWPANLKVGIELGRTGRVLDIIFLLLSFLWLGINLMKKLV